MPSPSWVGPQATPSNAIAAAATAFVTASPLARRLSIIEAWSCWDLSNPQSPSVVVTAFHQLAELIPDAGPPFASLLHSSHSISGASNSRPPPPPTSASQGTALSSRGERGTRPPSAVAMPPGTASLLESAAEEDETFCAIVQIGVKAWAFYSATTSPR
ncbi:hypothetical protein OC844_005716 [Tilletia horrida]|nr:hypothetical protein OC844_005716 [Tilletia horrida]